MIEKQSFDNCEYYYNYLKKLGYEKTGAKNSFTFKNNYIGFLLNEISHFKINDIGQKIISSRIDVTYDEMDFMLLLCKLHPEKMRVWRIENIINKELDDE